MPNNLYLVFSGPPDGVSAEEYERWYHQHVRENILVPGFSAGQRFAIAQTMSGSRVASGTFDSDVGERNEPAPFTHLALYEYDGRTIDELRHDLFARIESGETILPEWFDRVHFMTWDCKAIEDRVVPEPVSA